MLHPVREMRPVKDKELRLTPGDCEAMAQLGNHFADTPQSIICNWPWSIGKKFAAGATAQYIPSR